jgi:hypothetical protein
MSVDGRDEDGLLRLAKLFQPDCHSVTRRKLRCLSQADLDLACHPPPRIQTSILAGIRSFRRDLPRSLRGAVDRVEADHDQGAGLPDSKRARPWVALYTTINAGIGTGSPNDSVENVISEIGGYRLGLSNRINTGLWDAATGALLTGWNGPTANFLKIGHSLFALIAALMGAQVSRCFCRKNQEGTAGSVPAPVSTSSDPTA